MKKVVLFCALFVIMQSQINASACNQFLPLAALQAATGDTAAADTTISVIKAMGGVKYNNFCKLLPLLIKLQYAPNHYFALLHDPYDSAQIAQFAADSTTPGYIYARAVMTLVFNKQYAPVILQGNNNNNERHLGPDSGNNNSQLSSLNFNLYPNPSDKQITIETSLPSGKSGYFYIYNTLGKLVESEKLNNDVTLCNVEQLNQGIYFYRAEIPGETPIIGKLVIIK